MKPKTTLATSPDDLTHLELRLQARRFCAQFRELAAAFPAFMVPLTKLKSLDHPDRLAVLQAVREMAEAVYLTTAPPQEPRIVTGTYADLHGTATGRFVGLIGDFDPEIVCLSEQEHVDLRDALVTALDGTEGAELLDWMLVSEEAVVLIMLFQRIGIDAVAGALARSYRAARDGG